VRRAYEDALESAQRAGITARGADVDPSTPRSESQLVPSNAMLASGGSRSGTVPSPFFQAIGNGLNYLAAGQDRMVAAMEANTVCAFSFPRLLRLFADVFQALIAQVVGRRSSPPRRRLEGSRRSRSPSVSDSEAEGARRRRDRRRGRELSRRP